MNILDSKFYGVVEKFANLLILNALWLICSLPILTIGPATSAMLCVVRQWKLHQDTSSVRNFFYYFKENFKYSFIIGILYIGYSILLFFNLYYLNQDQTGLKIMMLVPLIVVSLLLLCIAAYIFPVLSHYQLSLKKTIQNSFAMSIAYFPTTILLFGVFLLLFLAVKAIPIFILIAFSVAGFIQYHLCQKVFTKIDQSLQ